MVDNFTALQAQDYKGQDLNCSESVKPGFCQLVGQQQASPGT